MSFILQDVLEAKIDGLKQEIKEKDYEIKVLRMSLISHGQIVEMNSKLRKEVQELKSILEEIQKDRKGL